MELVPTIRSYAVGLAIGGALVLGFVEIQHLRAKHEATAVLVEPSAPAPVAVLTDLDEPGPVVPTDERAGERVVDPGGEPGVASGEPGGETDLALSTAATAVGRATAGRASRPIDAAFGAIPAGVPASCRQYLAAVTSLEHCAAFPADARAAMTTAGTGLADSLRALRGDERTLATMARACTAAVDAVRQTIDATCPELGSTSARPGRTE